MKRTQRWTPDTCASPVSGDACVFMEIWDDEVDPVARTHEFLVRERACSFHAKETPEDAFNRCYAENRRKNVTFAMAKAVNPAVELEHFAWSYDKDGLLTVDFGVILGPQHKKTLKEAADIQFGPAKIRVV